MPELINTLGNPIAEDRLATAPVVQFPEEWCGTLEQLVLRLENTIAISEIPSEVLNTSLGIILEFPQFTDGRAYSQVRALRERGFDRDIRASGDVLVDQLFAMRRCGFSSFLLADGQDRHQACLELQRFDVAAQATINDEALRLRRWEAHAIVNIPKVA